MVAMVTTIHFPEFFHDPKHKLHSLNTEFLINKKQNNNSQLLILPPLTLGKPPGFVLWIYLVTLNHSPFCELTACLNRLAHGCDHMPHRKQLWGGRLYFGSRFEELHSVMAGKA